MQHQCWINLNIVCLERKLWFCNNIQLYQLNIVLFFKYALLTAFLYNINRTVTLYHLCKNIFIKCRDVMLPLNIIYLPNVMLQSIRKILLMFLQIQISFFLQLHAPEI
ncbi:hypothetical protein V1478_003762 [Vespula squamosa]|uniref:Uncharacterized protein n=1 Tax=Vespula squamosa TaxID=30214 RepID=A0ABD2BMR8_VESSQ